MKDYTQSELTVFKPKHVPFHFSLTGHGNYSIYVNKSCNNMQILNTEKFPLCIRGKVTLLLDTQKDDI